MDSSDIGETAINKDHKDERDDKGRSENLKIIEPCCTENEPVISPAKRKSELTVKDETKRRRNTECTRDYYDVSFTNVKDSVSIAINSEKACELFPSTFKIHDVQDSSERVKLVNKVGESNIKSSVIQTRKESDSEKHVQAKGKNLKFSETFDQFNTDLNKINDLENRNICSANSHLETGEKLNTDCQRKECIDITFGSSLLLEDTVSTIYKPVKSRPHVIHILDRECHKKPVIKSDVNDTELSIELLKTCSEISASTVAFTECKKGETPEKHGVMIKHVDESTTKETRKLLENRTDFEALVTQHSRTSTSIAENFAQFEGLAAQIMLTDKKPVSLNKSLHSLGTFSHFESGISKERCSEYIDVLSSNGSLDKVTTMEMIDHHQSPFTIVQNETESNKSDTETENSKKHDLTDNTENKLLKTRMMFNRALSVPCNTAVEVNQISDKKSKNPNIGKSSQEKDVSQQDDSHSDLQIIGESNSRRDPRIFRLHPIYLEPESKFVPVEDYKNDPAIVESQKQILASIEKQSATNQQLNLEPKSGPLNQFQYERQYNEKVDSIESRIALELYIKRISGRCATYFMQTYPEAVDDLSEFNRLTKQIAMNFMWSLRQHLLEAARIADETSDEEILDSRAVSPSQFIEKEKFPDMPAADENKSPKSLPDIYENKSLKSPLDGENSSLSDLPSYKHTVSPVSLPPKNETNETLKRDFPIFKEYPGLAEDPAKVKKDARYQKRFYKRQKPVRLPINWDMGTSSTEPDRNIDSENNQIQINENVSQNLREDGDRIHKEEKSEKVLYRDEETNYRVNDRNLLHYASEDERLHKSSVSETLQFDDDGYKISSFMEESPTSPTGSSKSNKSGSPEKK